MPGVRAALIVAGGIYLILLATLTRQAVSVWASDLTLWTHATQEAPRKVRPMLNRAQAVSISGGTETAVVFYHYALRLAQNPARPRDEQEIGTAYAQINLALLDKQARRDEDALARLRWLRTQLPDFRPVLLWCQQWAC